MSKSEPELQRLRTIRAAGGTFAEAIAESSSKLAPRKKKIVTAAGHRDHFGLEVCGMPIARAFNEVFLDLAVTNYRTSRSSGNPSSRSSRTAD